MEYIIILILGICFISFILNEYFKINILISLVARIILISVILSVVITIIFTMSVYI